MEDSVQSTLQTTALVNEAYLPGRPNQPELYEPLTLRRAAQAMVNLVNYAKASQSQNAVGRAL
jgi:hypothetical protein